VRGWLFSLFVVTALFSGLNRAEAETVTVPYGDINLVGEFIVAEDRKPSDNIVLILHGTLAHLGMETIKGLQTILMERGINTLSVNLSFGLDNRTGMYDCAVPHRHRYDDALRELPVWFDWLAKKGIKDITLLGHSRGGAQAALFAAEKNHPLLARLVLMAPATWAFENVRNGYATANGKPLAESLAKARALVGIGKGNEIIPGMGLLYCAGAAATANSFLSYYEPSIRYDTPSLMLSIGHPMLVVAASEDTIVPDVPVRVKPLTDKEYVRLAVVDGADHFFLDLFGEDVADAIEEFLDPGS
jgi:alpha-beta hydrolase superfamily lysophospholipase